MSENWNKVARKVNLLPTRALKKHDRYKLFSKLDMFMQYYTFEFDKIDKEPV
jgi:hypothetical protein